MVGSPGETVPTGARGRVAFTPPRLLHQGPGVSFSHTSSTHLVPECNGRTIRRLSRSSQLRRGRRGSVVPAAGVAAGIDAPAASRHGTAPWTVNPHTGRLTVSTAQIALLVPWVGAPRRRIPRCNTRRRLVPRPHALLRRDPTRTTLRHLLSRSQAPLRTFLGPQRSPGPVLTASSPTPGADCWAQRWLALLCCALGTAARGSSLTCSMAAGLLASSPVAGSTLQVCGARLLHSGIWSFAGKLSGGRLYLQVMRRSSYRWQTSRGRGVPRCNATGGLVLGQALRWQALPGRLCGARPLYSGT